MVASVCVTAADGDRGYWVLAPCGVCQERLFAYGPGVEVAVPDAADPRRWRTLRLRDVQPRKVPLRSARGAGLTLTPGRQRHQHGLGRRT